MTINHLGYLGANEIAALIRQRKLSPVEVITDILEWIERVEPRINAFAHFAPEEALRSARRAEELILRGDPLPPLLGVPVTIKDHVDVRGMPTRSGSTLTKAMAAAHDNPLVTRLKNAGAIVLGKTTTSEFGWKAVSQSPLHGITHNPWKHGFNAGASSAGAAAAAAAGCGPLHLGSDGAGSVRLPAHFCGLYGLKLTYGRIPLVPQMKGDHVVHFGPLTRNVEDAALMMDALSGPHHLDPMSLPSSGESYSRDIRCRPGSLRIAYSEDLGHARVDPEVRALVANAIRRIAGFPGVILSSVTPEWGIKGRDLQRSLWCAHQVHHYDDVAQFGDRMDPGLVACVEQSRDISLADYDALRTRKYAYVAEINAFFDEWDFLLTPAASVAAFPADRLQPADWPQHPWDWMSWAEFSYPFNMSGNPAASIPCGVTSEGLPVGLQIVGRRFDDLRVLQLSLMVQCLEMSPKNRPYIDA